MMSSAAAADHKRGKSSAPAAPFLVKFGFTVAAGLAGIALSLFWRRSQRDGLAETGGVHDNSQISEEHVAEVREMGLGTATSTTGSEDEEGFLLPEFTELVMGVENVESTLAVSTPKKSEIKEEMETEQEVIQLRILVKSLQEKLDSAEMQLLESYGLHEQEVAMRELDNQEKSNFEETVYLMKIESLISENQSLLEQLEDSSRMIAELETLREKNKLLKKKWRSDAEQAKEIITSLHRQVSLLQSREMNKEQESAELEKALEKLHEMENEARVYREVNMKLSQDMTNLVRRLEQVHNPPSCSISSSGEEQLATEVKNLRQENFRLSNELEQLKTDMFANIEELVYLRWINACLRYELRNYQPSDGKIAASNLSRTLSPKSEAKVKELIMGYAGNTGISDENGIADSDSEYSSQVSSGICDMTSLDVLSTSKHGDLGSKNPGGGTGGGTADASASKRRESVSSCSCDGMAGSESYEELSSILTEEVSAGQLSMLAAQTDAHGLKGRFLEAEKKCSHGRGRSDPLQGRRYSDVGRQYLAEREDAACMAPENLKLQRIADALQSSRIKRRSVSFSN